MVNYFPSVEDRIIGHELHGNCCHKYELKDLYLSDLLERDFEKHLRSGYFDEGIATGFLRVLQKEQYIAQKNLADTLSQVDDSRERYGYVSNSLRRRRLRLELKEQAYRNALSAVED